MCAASTLTFHELAICVYEHCSNFSTISAAVKRTKVPSMNVCVCDDNRTDSFCLHLVAHSREISGPGLGLGTSFRIEIFSAGHAGFTPGGYTLQMV